jgi:DNA-binding transcriptional MerR regulator
VLTIGQLARYVGVSTKTIRVYHAKKLLPEPERDAVGYRRYTARDAIELLKIRALAEAGVPLARINALRTATGERLSRALHQLDCDLTTRIRQLRAARQRLRRLDASHLQRLPAEVARQLEAMPRAGFSERWIALQTDLWILVFATHPEIALGCSAIRRAPRRLPGCVVCSSSTTAPTTFGPRTPRSTTSRATS